MSQHEYEDCEYETEQEEWERYQREAEDIDYAGELD